MKIGNDGQDHNKLRFYKKLKGSFKIEVGIRKYPSQLYIRTKPFPPASDSYTDSHLRYIFNVALHCANPPLKQTHLYSKVK